MTAMSLLDLGVAAGAGFLAGGINTLAGGGTLVSFPVLLALGVPPVTANVTSTVGLCPGYLGGAWAQRRDLRRQRRSVVVLAPVCAVGGLAGAAVLLLTSNDTFRAVAPWLILAACALLLAQEPLRRTIAARRVHAGPSRARDAAAGAAVLPAAVYGGFFGAGVGVMLMAVLGVVLDEDLPEVNAVKVTLSLVINVVAAVFFVFRADVAWAYAAVIAPASLVGGHVAGRLVGRISAATLRVVVVVFGIAVSIRLFTS